MKRWIGKTGTMFSDMMVSVRRHLWAEWVFEQVPGGRAVQKLPANAREIINYGLAQAARVEKVELSKRPPNFSQKKLEIHQTGGL